MVNRQFGSTRLIVSLDMKGCVCHFAKWQTHPSISKGTLYPVSTFNPYHAETFLFKPWEPNVFLIWNHHKCPSQLFPLHLNTYVMGLRQF